MLTLEATSTSTYLVQGLPEGSFAKIAKNGAVWQVWHSGPGKVGQWVGNYPDEMAAFKSLTSALAQTPERPLCQP